MAINNYKHNLNEPLVVKDLQITGTRVDNQNTLVFTKSIQLSADNATGGGLLLGDDGDFVDLNDGYGNLRFTSGIRIYSGNRTGSSVIQLSNTGQIQSTGANNTADGGGQIFLNGATGNRIDFNVNGLAAPAFTTRSVGTKIVLYPLVNATQADYAFGMENSTLWYSIPQAASTLQHRWYGGTTVLADLKGTGELILGGVTTFTGTASQKLQVNSGAYIQNNLGIGSTNPTSKLHVIGDTLVTGVSTFSNGPVIIGSGTSTGTASQRLQVQGGAYVSGNLGVGTTNPASNTQVAIAGTLGISEVGGTGTRTLFTSSTAGFVLNHNDNSQITFQTLGTNRLVYSHASNFWTIPSGTSLFVGSGTSTGTALQTLQVTGSAYVSGSVGIGTTNPTANLHVIGGANISGVVTAASFVGSGTSLTGLIANTIVNIDNNQIYYPLLSPTNTGTISSISASSTSLVFNPGTDSLGIGTTNPFSGQAGVAGLDVNRGYIFSRSLGTTSSSNVWAVDQDYYSLPSYKGVGIFKNGTAAVGNVFGSIPNADLGALAFQNTTNALIYTNGASPLIFGTLSAERLRIDGTSGNIGINTTSATSRLTVSGNVLVSGVSTLGTVSIASGIVTATTGIVTYYGDGSKLQGVATETFTITNDVTTNSTYYPVFVNAVAGSPSQRSVSNSKLTFNPSTGNFSATQFTSLSDVSKKTNIKVIQDSIESVKRLRGVKFDWIDNHQPSMGVIAQEVEEVLPEVVVTDKDGLKSVSYGNIIGLLIEAIKEQQIRIEELEKKLNA